MASCFLLGTTGAALAQASPVASGPLGTPITPPLTDAWTFSPLITKAQAAADARARGFGAVRGLLRDNYGN